MTESMLRSLWVRMESICEAPPCCLAKLEGSQTILAAQDFLLGLQYIREKKPTPRSLAPTSSFAVPFLRRRKSENMGRRWGSTLLSQLPDLAGFRSLESAVSAL